MNKIINKFLLTADKFMPELHTNSQDLLTVLLNHLLNIVKEFKNLENDVAYSDSKNLAKRTISDKVLKDRTYEIARNFNFHGYQNALASMVYQFFDKKSGSGISVNEQLATQLSKPVIKKSKRRKAYARFKGNIWQADLAEMESLPSKNKNVKNLLCVIDVFITYAWVKPLNDKKAKIVLNAFIEIVNKSNRKANKLWVDKEREFDDKLMQEWSDNNDILMYSAHNVGKSVIAERFIKTLKSKTTKNDSLSKQILSSLFE